MNTVPAPARRVLVALDARPESLIALERAVALAARLDAEIAALFVEDETLERLCGLPVMEVMLGAGVPRRPEAAILRHELRARAGAARRALERAAASRHLAWSFRVTRGRFEEEALGADPGADLVAPSRSVRRPTRRLAPAVGAVLGAGETSRALGLAAGLARAGGAPLLVLATTATLAEAATLRARIEVVVGSATPVTVAAYDDADEGGLAARLADLSLEVLVLDAPRPLTPERLARLSVAAGCDLVVLGGPAHETAQRS